MKKEVEELIESHLSLLKERIKDKELYEHILTSILNIHTSKMPYNQVFEQITNEIENITEEENSDIWEAIYFLTRSISGHDPSIRYIYEEEILEDEQGCITQITGEIYDFIYQSE